MLYDLANEQCEQIKEWTHGHNVIFYVNYDSFTLEDIITKKKVTIHENELRKFISIIDILHYCYKKLHEGVYEDNNTRDDRGIQHS